MSRYFYVVQRGDTLSHIAERTVGNASAFRSFETFPNRGENMICPGDLVMMPPGWVPLARAAIDEPLRNQ